MTGDRDLDALMGHLELEAARRRADPHFPIDADARLGAELDALGPGTHGPPTAAETRRLLAAVVAALPMPDVAPGGGPSPRRWWAPPSSGAPSPAGDQGAGLREAGLAVVTALEALAARLDAVEEVAVTPRRPPAGAAGAGGGDGVEGAGTWGLAMVELVAAVAHEVAATGGRVWWSGPEPERALGVLRGAGADAYATDPAGAAWQTGTDGRRADPVEHLQAVADGALSVAVLAGPLPAADGDRLTALCAALGRCATTVVVCSPTPAWWRELVGPVDADLGEDRPLAVDTWIGALGAAGWECRVDAAHGGRTYRLWATRP